MYAAKTHGKAVQLFYNQRRQVNKISQRIFSTQRSRDNKVYAKRLSNYPLFHVCLLADMFPALKN